ncbi:MAG: PEP-CTERM sorting domain-containing protein [Steroidobacteraceae bacterium]
MAAAALAMFALGASSAMAGPTATVDGITFPTGTNFGGYDFSTQTLYENLVTGAGQQNYGIGTVDLFQVNGGGPASNTYTYGQGGVYLNFVFSGFTAACVNSARCKGDVDFTGGTISFYADSSALSTSGSFSTEESAIETGGPEFLALSAEAQNAAGDTIIANLGGGTTKNFSDAGSKGFFAVSGGDAESYIAADGFANKYGPGGYAAVNFTSDDSIACGTNAVSSKVMGSPCTGQTYVSGSGTGRFNATTTVPEPGSLALLAAGLLGLWGVGRRPRSRKSA